jgi:hypothetical protein
MANVYTESSGTGKVSDYSQLLPSGSPDMDFRGTALSHFTRTSPTADHSKIRLTLQVATMFNDENILQNHLHPL